MTATIIEFKPMPSAVEDAIRALLSPYLPDGVEPFSYIAGDNPQDESTVVLVLKRAAS